jgi:hypothetical protein
MDLLKEYLLELSCQRSADGESEVYDAVADSKVNEAINKINNRHKISVVLKDFVEQNLSDLEAKIIVKIDGKQETKIIRSLTGLKNKPFNSISSLPVDVMALMAKRIIYALARSKEIIEESPRTRVLGPDGHKRNSGQIAHPDELFVYSIGQMRTKDAGNFKAIAEVRLMKNGDNGLYQMNVEGSVTYADRVRKIKAQLTEEEDKVILKYLLA